MAHPTTEAYLNHMVETGLVTGFRIATPEPPHDDLGTALVAVLEGALPGNDVADAVRHFHAATQDPAELDAFFAWAPPWGRILTGVTNPSLPPQYAAHRQLVVRAALKRWLTAR